MSNIIINDDLTIRTTLYDANSVYSLYDLNFYVPTTLYTHKPFVIIEDNSNLYDICELAFEKNSSNYYIYKFTPTQCLRLKSGKCKLTIMLINKADLQDSKMTKTLDISLDIEFYKNSHRLYISEQLSSEVTDMYKKVLDLTNMNIELYDKIRERMGE